MKNSEHLMIILLSPFIDTTMYENITDETVITALRTLFPVMYFIFKLCVKLNNNIITISLTNVITKYIIVVTREFFGDL